MSFDLLYTTISYCGTLSGGPIQFYILSSDNVIKSRTSIALAATHKHISPFVCLSRITEPKQSVVRNVGPSTDVFSGQKPVEIER